MKIVCMAEDGHALSCDFSLLRSTLVRMNSVIYCGFLALPPSFSDRAVSYLHPESIMEMSNSLIKRREYEVMAVTDSDSTKHAGDVPNVSGEKEII